MQLKRLSTLIAVGDVMLGDHPLYIGVGIGSKCSPSSGLALFEEVRPILRRGDMVLCNMESVLSTVSTKRGTERLSLRASPLWSKILVEAGFNVVSVANNHSYDHGTEAFGEMVSSLSRQGIVVVHDHSPVFVRWGNELIGLLALWISNPHDSDRMASSLRTAKTAAAQCDHLIMSVHWGDEFSRVPAQWQIRFAHELVQTGADIIIGHHPHICQPIEYWDKKVITYSLGNFVSDMCQDESRRGIIVEVGLAENGVSSLRVYNLWRDDCFRLKVVGQTTVFEGTVLGTVISDSDYYRMLKVSREYSRVAYRRYLASNWWRFPWGALMAVLMGGVRRSAGRLVHPE